MSCNTGLARGGPVALASGPPRPLARLTQVHWPLAHASFVYGSPLGKSRASVIHTYEQTCVGGSATNCGGLEFDQRIAKFIFTIRHGPRGTFQLKRNTCFNSTSVRSCEHTQRTQHGWALLPASRWHTLNDGDLVHVNYSDHRGVSYSHGHTFEFQVLASTCAQSSRTSTRTGTAHT